MKRVLMLFWVLLYWLGLNGFPAGDPDEPAETITFYPAPIIDAQCFDGAKAGTSAALSEEQADELSRILGDAGGWTDDWIVDRAPFSFDGEFALAGGDFTYYFGDEHNVIYYDHYFTKISEAEMRSIMDPWAIG